MSGFDAERHLRLLGERALAAGVDLQRVPLAGGPSLPDAAAAFAHFGVLDPIRARAIVEAYDGSEAAAELDRGTAAPVTSPPTPRQVHRLDGAVPTSFGVVRPHALICDGASVRMPVTIRLSPDRPPIAPPQLHLRSSDGAAGMLRYSGGWGGAAVVTGSFEAPVPTAPGATWVEIGTARFELRVQAPPPFAIHRRSEAERGPAGFLWSRLADAGHRPQPQPWLDSAAEALIAAGLLDRNDPELEALRWAAQQWRLPLGSRWQGSGSPPPATPERWRSSLTRVAPHPSPAGTVPVGAVSPVFDGVAVAVDLLRSDEGTCDLMVEVAGVPIPRPLHRPHRPLAWWAEDDRGNHYLGTVGRWSGRAGSMQAHVSFAALDPQATQLLVSAETPSHRAQVRLDLCGLDRPG